VVACPAGHTVNSDAAQLAHLWPCSSACTISSGRSEAAQSSRDATRSWSATRSTAPIVCPRSRAPAWCSRAPLAVTARGGGRRRGRQLARGDDRADRRRMGQRVPPRGRAAQSLPVSTKAAWLREPSGLNPSSGTRGSNPRLSAWESRRTPSSDGHLRVDTGDDLTPGIPFQPVSTRGQWGHRWGPGSGLSVTLRRCEIAFLPPLRRTNNSGSRFPSAIFSTDLFRASPFSPGTNIAGPR
jgi:hypothetical protein